MEIPRLYTDFARWWSVFSRPGDYESEAHEFAALLAAAGSVRRVLELGSGGGNNASHLKRWFQLTLTDVSHAMLDESSRLNPECEHLHGDMRSLRLGRTFDAVFVHDAVMYLTTEEDLRATVATAAAHLAPGGVALFVPDYTLETFRVETQCGGHDGDERSVRYLAWAREPVGTTVSVSFVYVLREGDGPVQVEHEEHVMGLFPRGIWLRLLAEEGFEPRAIPDPTSAGSRRELFLGTRR